MKREKPIFDHRRLDAALNDRKISIIAERVGTSRQSLWTYRKGIAIPSVTIAKAIADALDMKLDELIA